MGDNTAYKVNDDGSVTISGVLSEQEKNIIEILRIEKSKGGIFASRRMKKRAINYAKSVNYPDFKVDKLMLDNYPDEFSNYPKTTSLIVWLLVAITFLGGAISFTFPSYFEFESVSYNNERIDACKEYQRTGDVDKYFQRLGTCRPSAAAAAEVPDVADYRIPSDELERTLESSRFSRNNHLKDMMWYLFGATSCLTILFLSIRQCRRITTQINPIIRNKA